MRGVVFAVSASAVKMWAVVGKRCGRWPQRRPRVQALSSPAICSTRSTIRRRSLASLMPHEGLGQRQAVGGRQEVGDIGRRGRLGQSVRLLARRVRRAVEEERHRHLQDVRDLLQPARADPVRALLVFLHLLEGQAERVAELFLAHAQHHPAHPHPRAHVLVGRIGRLLRHHVVLSSLALLRMHPLLLTVQTRAQSVNCTQPLPRVKRS